MSWKLHVILKEGETLKHASSSTQGFMQETDVDVYSVVGADGAVVGSVTVTDHTAVRGFKRTVKVVQKDDVGKVVVDKTV